MAWSLLLLSSLVFFLFSLIFLIIGLNARRPKYKKDFFPKVSVISWFWKDGNIIERKIKNFLSLNYPGKYEVIIVDNASKDETKKICKKYVKRGLIKYFRTPKKYDRKAFGLDEAIKKVAKYDIIAMTDPDGISKKDWLISLVQPFKDKKVGAVIGLTHCGNFYKNIFTKLRAVEDEWALVAAPLGTKFEKDVHLICGANYAVRRKALESVGYHGKKTLGEDLELSIDLHNKGWKVKVADAEVWQEEVQNIREYIRQRLRWNNSLLETFRYYSKEIWNIFKKNPIGLFIRFISYPIQIFSLLSLIILFLGLFLSFNAFFLGLMSFLILNLAIVISLVRFKKTYLIPYVPVYLVTEPFLVVYCLLLIRYLKLRKRRIVWRSLHNGYYHAGSRITFK
jgi:cellulose synthase/poly-beta-1,6-N-acetylglucosamine synthase-like glycosyltransferase